MTGLTANTDARLRAHVLFVVTGVICLILGGVVYQKQVRLRQGDQGVYYRAAWSMRQGGADLYQITDDHGWHYLYPPLFAIVMMPLAEPPSDTPADERHWVMPDAARMVVLYLFNVASLFAALYLLVDCLHQVTPLSFERRLGLFYWPLLICLPPVLVTLFRGQVEFLLLLLIAGFTHALVRGRQFTAGLCLAGAIALKIMPAILLLIPLWRRDWRCLAGCAVGLLLGLGVIPALVVGPVRTAELCAAQWRVLLAPALGLGEDALLAKELLDAGATVNQSFQMVLHQTLHYGQTHVPPRPAPWVRAACWLLTALLTGLVLWRQGRAVLADGRNLLQIVGLLLVIMVLASPVCHLHYFTLCLPLTLAVVDRLLSRGVSWRCWAALLVALVCWTSFEVPPLRGLHSLNLPFYATLVLWVVGWLELRSDVNVLATTSSTARMAA